jgi:hypothetical protein
MNVTGERGSVGLMSMKRKRRLNVESVKSLKESIKLKKKPAVTELLSFFPWMCVTMLCNPVRSCDTVVRGLVVLVVMSLIP